MNEKEVKQREEQARLEAEKFVSERITIFSGHRHTGSHDIGKKPEGVTYVQGVTRTFLGPLAQKPGTLVNWQKPYTGEFDYPEVLIGPADKPEKRAIKGVQEEFQKLLARARAMRSETSMCEG